MIYSASTSTSYSLPPCLRALRSASCLTLPIPARWIDLLGVVVTVTRSGATSRSATVAESSDARASAVDAVLTTVVHDVNASESTAQQNKVKLLHVSKDKSEKLNLCLFSFHTFCQRQETLHPSENGT